MRTVPPTLPLEALAAELVDLGTATLGESGGIPMDPSIRPAWQGATVAGPAFTASCGAGDNLALHVAVASAPEGFVLVADVAADPDRGYWGEVLTTAAEARGLKGLVIGAGVRDTEALEAHGFGVFSTTVALRGATKEKPGIMGGEITVGGVEVRAGDWVAGDRDGVTVIRAGTLDAVVVAARRRADREEQVFTALRGGATTVELLGLDASVVRHAEP